PCGLLAAPLSAGPQGTRQALSETRLAGKAALALHFVFIENLAPLAARFENHLDRLAHRALSAARFGDVVRFALDFGPRVGDRDPEPHAMHHDNIGEIVANVRHLLRRSLRVRLDGFENRDLLDVSLVNVIHSALPRAFDDRWGVASADHAGLHALPLAPLQGDAVLGVEAFEFD